MISNPKKNESIGPEKTIPKQTKLEEKSSSEDPPRLVIIKTRIRTAKPSVLSW